MGLLALIVGAQHMPAFASGHVPYPNGVIKGTADKAVTEEEETSDRPLMAVQRAGDTTAVSVPHFDGTISGARNCTRENETRKAVNKTVAIKRAFAVGDYLPIFFLFPWTQLTASVWPVSPW